MTARLQARETHEQALHRLAAQAHEKGVELIVEENNAHYVTSASQPGKRHFVTLFSCDCPGFCRNGRCMHHALVLEAYHSIPAIEPDPGPGGGGATLPVESATSGTEVHDVGDVVLHTVAASPLDRANRPAIARYLDGHRTYDERWELVSALRGRAYDEACGLTDRALEAWCRARLGLPTQDRVCPSPMCAGVGHVQQHPTDDGAWCRVCFGTGVVPSVAVAAIAAEAVRHAA